MFDLSSGKLAKCVSIVLGTMLCLALMGCTSKDDEPPSQKEVLEEVASQVVSERYELVSVDHDTVSRPMVDTYTFKSLDRDLTFNAYSTLRPIGFDASVVGYDPYVYLDYAAMVKGLYEDDIYGLLTTIGAENNDRCFYESYDELKGICECIAKANEMYAAELKVNTEEWLVKNPFAKISVTYRWIDENGKEQTFFMGLANIDGVHTYDQLYESLSYSHAYAVKYENVTDDTVPTEAFEGLHPDELDSIMFSGQNLTSRAVQLDSEAGRVNQNETYYHVYYYQPWNQYMVILDVGQTGEDYAPRCMQMYDDALNLKLNINSKKYIVSWNNGKDKWEMHSTKSEDGGYISDMEFYKNDKPIDMRYLSCNDAGSPARATYLIAVTVDDLADMLGVTYRIDEENRYLELYK